MKFTESTAERAALQWLSAIGYAALSGASATPGGDTPQRTEHTQPILPERLHQALSRINPHLPPEAITEAQSRILRLESPTLIEANQEYHSLVSDGVPAEVRGPDGVPRIEKAWLFDFEHPERNDLLAINQFTVRDSTTGHTDRPELSILDERFLDGIRGMQQRHLAPEALRKLLTDEIRSRSRVNVVQGRRFKELLEETLNRYRNRAIDTAQVIDELITLAKHVQEEGAKGEALKLSPEEVAFYDALATARDVEAMKRDGTLQALARELAKRIRENASIDWTMKETVRAQMRAIVKRLLRKYKYPPESRDTATETVLEQAERMATNHAGG